MSLSLKLLFRKKSTAAAVIALALLVAVVASMTAIVNFVDTQTSAIGQLASVGNKFLVIARGCSSLDASEISVAVADAFNQSDFSYVAPQKLLPAILEAAGNQYSVDLRGVGNLSDYMKAQSAYVNGSWAKNHGEGNAGALLAKTAGLSKGDYVNVTASGVVMSIKIVGIADSRSQLDSELLLPLETTGTFTGSNNVSFVEFSLKRGINREDAINQLSTALPADVQIVKVQQTAQFLQSSIGEIHNFLAVWSYAVYVLVAASSYIICTRLLVESEYEFSMLASLGTKRRGLFSIVFVYALLAALAGAVLGVSLGIVGTQAASSGLRWVWQNVSVTPYLDFVQVGQIIGLSVVFCVLGSLYPALKVTRSRA